MSIKVIFDDRNRQYLVSNCGRQIAALPLVYLEGRKGSHIKQSDIERAFTDVFDGEGFETDIQKRGAAFASLGLITKASF